MTRARLFGVAMIVAVLTAAAGPVAAQSLEEQTRRPPGTNSLQDDSDRLRQQNDDAAPTDSLDDDSQELRGRTPDQDGTNSLDDGSMQGGDGADAD
jgi:hypothetical protein